MTGFATSVEEAERGGHWLLEQTSEETFENDAPSLEDADEKIPYPETLPGLSRGPCEAARTCRASDGDS